MNWKGLILAFLSMFAILVIDAFANEMAFVRYMESTSIGKVFFIAFFVVVWKSFPRSKTLLR